MKNQRLNGSYGKAKGSQANPQFLLRRHHDLLKSEAALQELFKGGLSLDTIKRYKLGLSHMRIDRGGVSRGNALLAPVLDESGSFTSKTVYFDLTGITVNPSAEQWTKGAAVTYYSSAPLNQKMVFVCESLHDLWLTVQNTSGETTIANEILFICSSHRSISTASLPAEWHDSAFWSRFGRVFSCFSADAEGDIKNNALRQFTGVAVFRFFPPFRFGISWSDFWQNGGNAAEFKKLLNEAVSRRSETMSLDNRSDEASGFENEWLRTSFNPVDISCGYFNGFLHYPINTLVSENETVRDSTGKTISRRTYKTETVIVRSDRTIHKVIEEPAPRGTPRQQRIYRLTDGTVVESPPAAPKNATWSWDSIDQFIHCRAPPARSLDRILDDVNGFLRVSVRLSYSHDYDLLTLLVPITYAQAIFSAVPIILIRGVAGSGKTTLGRAMADISANSVVIGQATVASAAREIHESRGLIVLDDLESIGATRNKKGGRSSEFEQMLKVSYKQSTGWRQFTDMRNGIKTKRYNLFGVKIISNTTGSDAVLASRMIEIRTEKLSDFSQDYGGSFRSSHFGDDFCKKLRNELHTWVFENTELIAETYERLFSSFSDRETEITAPLRVFAEICAESGMRKRLDNALSYKRHLDVRANNISDLVKIAAEVLVLRGTRDVSATAILSEVPKIASREVDLSHIDKKSNEINVATVGKIMRQLEIIESDCPSKRVMQNGKFLRVYQFSDRFIRSVSEKISVQQ